MRLTDNKNGAGKNRTVMRWSFGTNKEQLDEARASAADVRKSLAAVTERVQSLQSEWNQSELRQQELEAELSNTQEVRELVCVGGQWIFW